MKKGQDHYRGCLLGGAAGDALGAAVEFLGIDAIREKFGEPGITELQCSESGYAEITDDTQMALFTAEGILRAISRGKERGIWHPSTVIYYAYQRWLVTQGYSKYEEYDWIYNGWLLGVPGLHAQRAPGNTCLSALLSRKMGTIENPINNSKGCGGIMRVAPVALALKSLNHDQEFIFQTGAESAAITHGHPSGYLSAGVLSSIIASILDGLGLHEAVSNVLVILKNYHGHQECSDALLKAIEMADRGLEDFKAIKELGEGWVGEEALAIAVFCALKYSYDYRKAVTASVNHSGDSDSTGSITGNILGASLGLSSIPADWLDKLELREVITRAADDLLTGHRDDEVWWERYPGF